MKNTLILITKVQVSYLLFAIMLLGINSFTYSQGCSEIPTSILDGTNGFSIEGKLAADDLGTTTKTAGDINGDGIPDLMIGAPGVDFNGLDDVGEVYVIFGKKGLSIDTFDLTTLDGTNGFVIRGVSDNEKIGNYISTAGDINNDGIDDIMICTSAETNQAKVIIILGSKTGFSALYNRTDFDISNSITITSDTSTNSQIIDLSTAGDVNNDGINDIILNVSLGIYNQYSIIYGESGLSDLSTSTLNGTNGFIIEGYQISTVGSGSRARNAGDINNDGFDDLILGIPRYDEGTTTRSGRVIIWYGRSSSATALYGLDTMTAADGTVITNTGTVNYVSLGESVATAGDFNNDGIDDVLFGAPGKDINGLTYVGEAYLLFGKSTPFPQTFSTSAIGPTEGILFQGQKSGKYFGKVVNTLNDINNDGINDIIIATPYGGISNYGAAYIVFGGTTSTGTITDQMIFGNIGYQIYKDASSFLFGSDADGLGDFNDDGTNDFVIGAIPSYTYYNDEGNAYVFYGEQFEYTDITPPTISCPSSQELYANATLPNYISYLPTVTDNCTDSFDLTFTQSPPQGTLFTTDTNVTVTVADKAGNTNSCSFLVALKTNNIEIECNTTSLSIKNLNGNNGFTVYGEITTREAGSSVNNAGDVNGDGIQDFIIGAPGNYAPWYGMGREYKIIKGAAFVVYGTASGFPPNVDLGLLNGTNGFAIRNDIISTNFPVTGYAVGSAGDLNGDGISDFMISDPYRHSSYGAEVGHTYIVFGKAAGFPAEFNLSSLDGTNGFTLIGVNKYGDVGLGIDTIGDVNGDGIDDIAAISAGSGEGDGKCYIVYGNTSGFPAVLLTNQIDGTNGFVVEGDATTGAIKRVTAGLGDVNNDGHPDFSVGSNFVIYGRSTNFPANLNVSSLDGTNGFILENSEAAISTYAGISKIGDMNGDGYNDIAITEKYILFGGPSIPAKMDLKNLDGTNGFTLNITSISYEFNAAGDFNDDGFDDYVFRINSTYYVLFGKDTWEPIVNLSSLTAKDALKITTTTSSDYSVNNAGDVNNDGISDLIIGSSYDSYGNSMKINRAPGFAYVIFGKKITDTEKPVITNCPANKILSIGTAIPDYTTSITVKDNCDSNPVVTQNPAAGTVYTGGTQVITLTATDAHTNFATCTFNISTNLDTEAPVITCPTDQELPCGSLIPNYLSLVTATDNVTTTITITQSPGAGTTFTDGMTIKFTAKDEEGNESDCSILVTTSGTDTVPPTFDCLTGITLNCGDVLPNYAEDPALNLADNCSKTIKYMMTPAAGTKFYDGIEVIIDFTDEANNTASCKFIVNASADTTKPVITCIADQTLDCGDTIPDYLPLISVTDNCDTTPTLTQSPVAGTTFVDGMTITITTEDAANNIETCTFLVNTSADNTKPVISCIADQTLDCGATIPDYLSLISVTDNCDTAPVLTQSPVAGTTFVDGMTITITAEDAANNIETCTFLVNTSADTTKPVISCIADQTLDCGATIPDYLSLISVTDNCDTAPVLTQSPVAGTTFVDGMTITITAEDVSGNYDTCDFKVYTVADTTKPVISCIANQTLDCGATVPDYLSLISVTDNCDTAPVLTQSPVAGSAFVDGMTITITATDTSGNSENCTFLINTSADTTKPVISCIADQTVDCGDTVPDYLSLISVSDNCDITPVLTQSPVAGSTFVDGMTITITAIDASGNYTTCDFKVSESLLTINAGSDIYINEDEEVQLQALASINGDFKWEPSIGLNNPSIANPMAFPKETTTYTVLFTNDAGCLAEDNITVYVEPIINDNTKYGFSPNNDGINDFWKIDTIEENPENEVFIYNRWGDLVFYIKGYNNNTNVFNGIANKKRSLGADVLPEGTYFFEIRIEGSHHLKKTKGFLVLKR
ncbi:gliding motility-associated-like protein [Flavobacterium sp. 7E]|uniref:HYR domain-containing protein n=1 Tax=Flavobacterium sp. 7E TaxID=2735898 RepID=UPI00156E0BB6|nr:HYR domain-containing protein [Flavobacterium sp. 7E]NRS89200.1 gliding motility-associated-like protein [Flavobacterium sp. 7E]